MSLKFHWPWIAWLGGIVIATSIPGDSLPDAIIFQDWMKPDKWIHIGLFAVLVFLALRSYMIQYQGKYYRFIYASVLIISLGIGAITELMQKYILSAREGNVYDFGADALGCLTGLVIFNL
ncbi:MAG: VanZ family protein, partial [Bacteroidales bacterium]|nr:VanZ family protein [Bacteroidales bacterium]MCF8338222.1 VanZ family protein [Bacteroidales bacterium]